MHKIESTVRSSPFILRVFILLSWIVSLFMLIFNPAIHGSEKDETIFQLIFISSTLLAIYLSYLYFNIPRVPITLMRLNGSELSFRTMRNPALGIGEDFQEEYVIDINDVLYIYPYIQYLHQVGSYFCITFYCQEAGVFPTYYETEHKDRILKLLDEVLAKNIKIQLINDRGYAMAIFPALEERMLQEIPDGYRPDGSSRRILFSEKFTEKEWHDLLLCPFQVFRVVAGVDGNIDKWESRALVSTLKSASQQRSFLVADLLGDALAGFDSLFDLAFTGPVDSINLFLPPVLELVDREGDDIDRRDFRDTIRGFAQSVAESSGLGDHQVSSEEKQLINKINHILETGNL